MDVGEVTMDYTTQQQDKIKDAEEIEPPLSESYQTLHYPSPSPQFPHDQNTTTNCTTQSHDQHDEIVHDTGDRRSEYLESVKLSFSQPCTSEMLPPVAAVAAHNVVVSSPEGYGTQTTDTSICQSLSQQSSTNDLSEQLSYQLKLVNQSPTNIVIKPVALIASSLPHLPEHSESYRLYQESLPSAHYAVSTKSLEHSHSSYKSSHDQPVYPEDMAKTLACSTQQQQTSNMTLYTTPQTEAVKIDALNNSKNAQVHQESLPHSSCVQPQLLRPQSGEGIEQLEPVYRQVPYPVELIQKSGEIIENLIPAPEFNVKGYDQNTSKESKTPSCPCTEQLIKQSKERNPKKYICGGCLSKFVTICLLHEHVKCHGIGGSYHYDHVSHTAYPKYDTFCSFTQTDDLYERYEESSVIDELASVQSKIQNSHDPNTNKVLDNEVTQANQETPSPVRKNRRRKQDNPKPSKLRVMDEKKNEKTKRPKKRNEAKTKKGSNSGSQDELIEVKLHLSVESVIKDSVDSNPSSSLPDQHLEMNNEMSCLVDSETNSNIAKPLKKRGRSRKETSACKNVPLKRKAAKKAEELINTQSSDDVQNDTVENIVDHDTDNGASESKKLKTETKDVPVGPTTAKSKPRKQRKKPAGSDVDKATKPPKSKQCKSRKNATKYEMCDICGLPVPANNYDYHTRQHTGEKPFICDKCGKAFAHRRFLVKHMLTHAEEKPWKCNLCSAQFCQKSEYKMHMNGHEGVRPHECKVCGMKFFSKAMLNTHQANVHMGITRFECNVCNRRFFKRSSLNVHKATHYEATMKCNFCDRKFKDRAGLKRHERIHTGEKRFQCHVCNHGFIQSTPYWVHMEKRHQMDRDMVKNILAEIRQANKRSGIKTEINVLPADVDLMILSKGNTTSANDNPTMSKPQTAITENRNVKVEYITDKLVLKNSYETITDIETSQNLEHRPVPIQKYYTDIKVPNVYPSSGSDICVMSGVYSSQGVEMEPSSTLDLQQQYHRFLMSASETSSTSSTIHTNHPVTSQSTIPVTNMTTPVSLGSLNISALNPLHQHGFIGLNTLQQALDYSNSLPQPGTYTDISQDSVNHSQ